jgi:hypothetical protein
MINEVRRWVHSSLRYISRPSHEDEVCIGLRALNWVGAERSRLSVLAALLYKAPQYAYLILPAIFHNPIPNTPY